MTETNPDAATVSAVRSCRDALPPTPAGGDVVFGFDGYVDTVRQVRTDIDGETTEPLESLAALRDRIGDAVAADSSLALDWHDRGRRAGGHVCHLARAWDRLEYDPTLLGMLGKPQLPLFDDEFGHLETHSLGEPGYTDAMEFEDGKLMLNEEGDIRQFDWETLTSTLGRETLVDAIDGTELFGIGYWAMAPRLPSVFDGLRDDVWPSLTDPPGHVLLDPADIRKLNGDTVEAMVEATERLDDVATVTLSANRAETRALADALGRSQTDDPTRAVFDAVDVSRVVTHGVYESRSFTASDTASVAVSPVADPEMTTSAGDHFNAGLSFGLVGGFDDAEALVVGNALARQFVVTGTTPTYGDLTEAVESYLGQFD
ncbi:PfkB family carbohydrate kinase [Halomicroarcula sp. S1AR25-4]|uniref:PfkB family carbohydrate kinase n=1 Tax=Haloarcula sp. S1AR25-4 TaxID=2950538 RepID=UPI0028747B60|nr:PfkB family carbohydrate kinase [Halomicroarcula sp. S1AR25-4]MDS0279805.1 PfkB family carbohydrate kinase [Halomicroarcula sp. S1AR25-4]